MIGTRPSLEELVEALRAFALALTALDEALGRFSVSVEALKQLRPPAGPINLEEGAQGLMVAARRADTCYAYLLALQSRVDVANGREARE